ncbi:hypothetical protein SDC9_165530 [bioreactor metagenome]|uniref:Uncharacterized protein n=1 Tax=bioreactor metagenome TaxID=1076179 RepID=A0A645FWU3_9ZZZZ
MQPAFGTVLIAVCFKNDGCSSLTGEFIDNREYGFQLLVFRALRIPARQQFRGFVQEDDMIMIVAGDHPVTYGDERDFVNALLFFKRHFQSLSLCDIANVAFDHLSFPNQIHITHEFDLRGSPVGCQQRQVLISNVFLALQLHEFFSICEDVFKQTKLPNALLQNLFFGIHAIYRGSGRGSTGNRAGTGAAL